ncbi:MAG TPA: DUF1501 domain-containing protein [Polyangiaceae bacterium]|nr:DUF1501 domain-containing protein [Polyangiaceae bacterium]
MEPLMNRRAFGALGLGTLAGLLSARLGLAEDVATSVGPTKGIIVLWLRGGPSQLETFDPKPGKRIGGPTRAITTSAKGIAIAHHLPQIAEQMQHLSLIRSVVGQEGDHERASILMKTGRRPEVALSHPSLGAVCAHELDVAGTEIPRYVSILSNDPTSRGGYLGQSYDPFRVGDPANPIQDVTPNVGDARQQRRLEALEVLENGFARERPEIDRRTLHRERTERAIQTMSSTQLEAFDVEQESRELRRAYGDHPFGRGCLAARRLLEVGVRCVEVALDGWDTHIDHFDKIDSLCRPLDSALATLVKDLRDRGLWEHTLVFCGGEFGRTPRINGTDGRDHWPTGFSVVLGGGPLAGGALIGETGIEATDDEPKDPVPVADVYATLLCGLGLDPATENMTSVGRPVKLSDGKPIERLLKA